jgi:hypothetical protein
MALQIKDSHSLPSSGFLNLFFADIWSARRDISGHRK